jgi:hypothetical protein
MVDVGGIEIEALVGARIGELVEQFIGAIRQCAIAQTC